MSDQWHYSRSGKQFGPVSGAELKQLASTGELVPSDLLWTDGLPNWVTAQRIKGLFVAPPPVPAVALGPFTGTRREPAGRSETTDEHSRINAASKGERAAAYIIDVIPAMILGFTFGWIPILGAIISGFILGAYWLLRDVSGASIGKLLLGLRVVGKNGRSPETGKRILRNLTLAIGPAFLIIPIFGYVFAPIVAFLLFIVEAILLLTQGERLGDKIAGTSVIRHAKLSRGSQA